MPTKTFISAMQAAVVTAAIVIAQPAAAAVSKGEALTACTTKAEETYGANTITKLKRIKKRGDYKVQMFVTGASDSRFVTECVVNKDSGEVTSIEPAKAP